MSWSGEGVGEGEGEFALIGELERRWGSLARGLGDDAAVLSLPRGERLAASTDASVAGVHFRYDWMSPREIGRRAVVAALSDLAAMGASPVGILLSFAFPDAARALILDVADGCGDAVRDAGTVIIGGNIAAASELSITTTVLGRVFRPLTRSGARPGQSLWVTGSLGGPAAALRALKAGAEPAVRHRERLVDPRPRLREGAWLATEGAVACIDISDGLVADAGHLARASGVALEIHVERLPILEGGTTQDALGGGEEYELLVAGDDLGRETFAQRFGLPLTRIGQVLDGPPTVHVLDHGKRVAAPKGYDHFSR